MKFTIETESEGGDWYATCDVEGCPQGVSGPTETERAAAMDALGNHFYKIDQEALDA